MKSPEEVQEIWRSLTGLQRILVIDAKDEHWSQGNPVPTDVYMTMTDAGLDVDLLQDYFMEAQRYDEES